jgi:hypothetical protein
LATQLTGRVVEDIAHLDHRDLGLLELHDVEPAASFLLVVQLEHEVVEENVPTDNLV